jgi:hypothetical protein
MGLCSWLSKRKAVWIIAGSKMNTDSVYGDDVESGWRVVENCREIALPPVIQSGGARGDMPYAELLFAC